MTKTKLLLTSLFLISAYPSNNANCCLNFLKKTFWKSIRCGAAVSSLGFGTLPLMIYNCGINKSQEAFSYAKCDEDFENNQREVNIELYQSDYVRFPELCVISEGCIKFLSLYKSYNTSPCDLQNDKVLGSNYEPIFSDPLISSIIKGITVGSPFLCLGSMALFGYCTKKIRQLNKLDN